MPDLSTSLSGAPDAPTSSTIEVSKDDLARLRTGSLSETLKQADVVEDPKTGRVRVTSANPAVTSKLSDAISGRSADGGGGLLDRWTAASSKYTLPSPGTVAAATPTGAQVASGLMGGPGTPSAPPTPAGGGAADPGAPNPLSGPKGAPGLFQLGGGGEPSTPHSTDTMAPGLPDPGRAAVQLPPPTQLRTDYKFSPVDAEHIIRGLGDGPAVPQIKDEATGQLRPLTVEDGVMAKDELDEYTRQLREVTQLSKDAIARNKWGEVAETLGHALTQFAAAKQGMALTAKGQPVSLANLHFDKTDWLGENRLALDQAKQDLGEIEGDRSAAETRYKTIRDSLDNLGKRREERLGLEAKLRGETDRTNAEGDARMAGINADNERAMSTDRERRDSTRATIEGEDRRAALTNQTRLTTNANTNETREGIAGARPAPGAGAAQKQADREDQAGRQAAGYLGNYSDLSKKDPKFKENVERSIAQANIPPSELARMRAEAHDAHSWSTSNEMEALGKSVGEYVERRSTTRGSGGGSGTTPAAEGIDTKVDRAVSAHPDMTRDQVLQILKQANKIPADYK